jgi:hypothetical protein
MMMFYLTVKKQKRLLRCILVQGRNEVVVDDIK